MLHQQEGLGQGIHSHIISTNEQEFDQTISDAFMNEVIPNVNMFHCRVVDWVPGKQISSSIVDIQGGGALDIFPEFRQELMQPDKFFGGLGSGNIFGVRGQQGGCGLLL